VYLSDVLYQDFRSVVAMCSQGHVVRNARVSMWIALQLHRRCVAAHTSKVHLRFRSVVEVSTKRWHVHPLWCSGTLTVMQYQRSCCKWGGGGHRFVYGSCLVSGAPPVMVEVFHGIPVPQGK
jgi:hypothetical protein